MTNKEFVLSIYASAKCSFIIHNYWIIIYKYCSKIDDMQIVWFVNAINEELAWKNAAIKLQEDIFNSLNN